MAVAVALVVVAVRGRANVPQETTKHRLSRYHRHQGRGNEERKPDRTMVVGMPSDHGEQQDRPVWLPLFIATLVMSVIVAIAVVRGFLTSIRADEGDNDQRDGDNNP